MVISAFGQAVLISPATSIAVSAPPTVTTRIGRSPFCCNLSAERGGRSRTLGCFQAIGVFGRARDTVDIDPRTQGVDRLFEPDLERSSIGIDPDPTLAGIERGNASRE